MRLTPLLAFVSATIILAAPTRAGAQDRAQLFREGVNLYENAVYERARTVFESIDDPLSQAYVVLCAVKSGSPDHERLYREYMKDNPESILAPRINYEYASDRFAKGDYASAGLLLKLVPESAVSAGELPDYRYKRAYCAFAEGDNTEAAKWFGKVLELPKSSLTAPSCYELGYIAYSDKDFAKAEDYFTRAARDGRFKDVAEYYILECRFMRKDYDYVIAAGPEIMDTVPAGRKPRLARILSESYLVKGRSSEALKFLNMEGAGASQSRLDLFHAGSVRYAVNDYAGAIDNFSKMSDRSDSLGQIANYYLGFSYIQTLKKVDALDAFRDASAAGFDAGIKEDALYNYAKLAFDLNSDTSVFEEYLKAYPDTEKKEQIYDYQAIAALNRQDYASAIAAYSRIDELNETQKSNYMKANFLRGGQLLESGACTDAAAAFKSASYYAPRQERLGQLSRYWMAESLFKAGEYAEAAAVYTDLYNVSAVPDLAEGKLIAYNLAYSYYNQKKYDSAAKWFDNYIGSRDKLCRKDALTRRADCDFARHNYKAAVSSYKKVLDEFGDPDDIYPYYQQGLAYGLAGNKPEKIKVLSKVKGASPDAPLYADAMYELGRAYMDAGDNNSAVATFETLANAGTDKTVKARAIIGQGMAYRNMQNYDKSLSCYKSVVALMPDSGYAEESIMAINSIYQTMNRPEQFLDYMQSNKLSLGNTEEEKAEVYFNTAEQIYIAGDYKRSQQAFYNYLNDYPEGGKRGEAWFYLADSYRCLGEKEKALKSYSMALTLLQDGPFVESATLQYSALSMDLQHYSDAYEGYSKLLSAARMKENRNAALRGRVLSAYSAHLYDKAVAAADDLIASSPGDAVEREALFIKGESLLAVSRRAEAMDIFKKLSAQPATAEGAQSSYLIIKDLYDNGKFTEMENAVYDFAGRCGNQSYWLARAYIVLGDGFKDRGNAEQARATWESIMNGYTAPAGGDDILDIVKQRLTTL